MQSGNVLVLKYFQLLIQGVCHVQAGLVDAENDNIVEEEVRESPHQPNNNNGDMDAIRMIMECLSRYDNLEDEDPEDGT